MKTLLVQAPGSYVDMPVLGIPCLSAQLKASGFEDVYIWDSNLDFLYYLLDPNTLNNHMQQLDILSSLSTDDAFKKDYRRAAFIFPNLLNELPDAFSIFRDPERYYNPSLFTKAFRTFQNAVQLYGTSRPWVTPVYNTNGVFVHLSSDRGPFTLEHVFQAIRDPKAIALFWDFFDSHETRLRQQLGAHNQYDLVGLSCSNPHQILTTLMLAQWLREKSLAAHIVMGGSFVTTIREHLCSNPEVYKLIDSIVTFEGEYAITALATALSENPKAPNLKHVPNLNYCEGSTFKQNAPTKVNDLSALPTPDFSGFQLERYFTPEPVLPAYTARGCFYDICAFCNHHENYFGSFRTRKTAQVISDLKTYLAKYKSRSIFFVDELMVPKQQIELAEAIVSEGLGTRWYAHSRVEKKYGEKEFKVMAKGGLTLLHVGMESANTRVLGLMRKGYTREDVIRFLSEAQKAPITLHINTIRGYPGEDPQEYIETLETVLAHAKVGDSPHLYEFGFLKNSPLDKEGSPYLERQPAPEQLNPSLTYTLKDVRSPTEEEIRKINYLRFRLGHFAAVSLGLFPEHSVWASNLLYSAYHREHGRSDLMDQALCQVSLTSGPLSAFFDAEEFSQWVIRPRPDLILEQAREPGLRYCISLNTFHVQLVPELFASILNSPGGISVTQLQKETQMDLEDLQRSLYALTKGHYISMSYPSPERTSHAS